MIKNCLLTCRYAVINELKPNINGDIRPILITFVKRDRSVLCKVSDAPNMKLALCEHISQSAICGVNRYKIMVVSRIAVENKNVILLNNESRDFFPLSYKMSLKIGIIAALIEPATITKNTISGIVKEAQKISKS